MSITQELIGTLTISNVSYRQAQAIANGEYGSLVWHEGKAYPTDSVDVNGKPL